MKREITRGFSSAALSNAWDVRRKSEKQKQWKLLRTLSHNYFGMKLFCMCVRVCVSMSTQIQYLSTDDFWCLGSVLTAVEQQWGLSINSQFTSFLIWKVRLYICSKCCSARQIIRCWSKSKLLHFKSGFASRIFCKKTKLNVCSDAKI